MGLIEGVPARDLAPGSVASLPKLGQVGASPVSRLATATIERHELLDRFQRIRRRSETLVEPLSAEDATAQSMPDASPAKWHLAHTSWFFETFVLEPHAEAYRPVNPAFRMLFNSYYNAVGAQHPRPQRGLITRPALDEVMAYRRHVTDQVTLLLAAADSDGWEAIAPLVSLGIAHEEQHQELILTDLLHLLSCNPLLPAYRTDAAAPPAISPQPLRWIGFDGGTRQIGRAPPTGGAFAFDNEGPEHLVHLRPFTLASRPINNREYLAFIEDGGYADPHAWLADGWTLAQREGWQAPLYWRRDDDGTWWQFGLTGLAPLDEDAPVCHLSYFEADAFARWAGKRLPTEAEWEVAAQSADGEVNDLGSGRLRPVAAADPGKGPIQMFGDVWEWTASAYSAYPGFRAADGALGEYNGKFMSGQMVLRGGSCATPPEHLRTTYRNYFYPHQRWQFSGLRLAEDA